MLKNNQYKEAIDKYGFFIATPIGTSMLPLLKERLDTVKLVKPKNLKVGDVVLYVRRDNTHVLHRIMKIKNHTYTMCGDNQWVLEKGIKEEQIIGLMEGFYKGEKYIDCLDKDYLKYVKKRMGNRRLRHFIYIIKRPLSFIKHKILRK